VFDLEKYLTYGPHLTSVVGIRFLEPVHESFELNVLLRDKLTKRRSDAAKLEQRRGQRTVIHFCPDAKLGYVILERAIDVQASAVSAVPWCCITHHTPALSWHSG
jgi:hypothetical protein